MTATVTAWPRLEDVADDIRAILDRARVIACLPHKDADADSLGSALAFALSMRAMGRDVRVVVPPPAFDKDGLTRGLEKMANEVIAKL